MKTPQQAELEGLRGICASLVFLSHAAIYPDFLRTGRWELPPSRVFSLFGPVGVGVFFMLTAYLFGRRAWSDQVDWRTLYIGRLFRIGPLYLLAASFVLIGAVIAPQAADPQVANHMLRWLALGALGHPDINGFIARCAPAADVTWSLQWEWGFYAMLPLIALARRWALGVSAIVFFLGLTVCDPMRETQNAACIALFGAGLIAAAAPPLRFSPRAGDALLVVLIASVFACASSGYSGLAVALLAPAFLLVTWGASLGGVLTSNIARRLGRNSYGIYLLQGPALMAAFAIPGLRQPAGPAYLLAVTLAGCLLLIAAEVAHRLIERPGVALGKALSRGAPHVSSAATKA